jgi:GNAT superfamily N-acetyltransferase
MDRRRIHTGARLQRCLTSCRPPKRMHSMPTPEPGDVVIRRALPADVEALVRLCKDHADFERVGYEAHGKAACLSAALFSDAPRLYAWVAVTRDALVGYATASREYSTWSACEYLQMDCLFVRSNARGAGLGAALLKTVVAVARDLGVPEIQWQTPDWNVDASQFYQRHGDIAKRKLRFTLDIAK